MFNKTLISEFFTTVSFTQMYSSFYMLTFWIINSYKVNYVKQIEEKLLKIQELDDSKIISLYSWRNAIHNALKLIWIDNNDEIIVSWYTCSVVVNAVLNIWWNPIYCDIEPESLGLDIKDLKTKITKKTKVIIIQHTFWKQVKYYKEILKLAKKEKILVIEDCAHSLWNNQKIEWDFAIFSTWRDKVISSVTWWFLIINNSQYFTKIWFIKNELQSVKPLLVWRNLNYDILWYLAYKLYDFLKIWRLIIHFSRKLWLITEVLTYREKRFASKNFSLAFPNSLAYLALRELKKIKHYTKIRLDNSNYYLKYLNNKNIEIIFKDLNDYNWFRFPIIVENTLIKEELYSYMRKNSILLWNTWSWTNIVPMWVNLVEAKYKLWSCPNAERISEQILTLPNHSLISKKDLKNIVELLNKFEV